MFKKIKNIFFSLFFLFFLFFTFNYYFSEENIIKVNKMRSNYYSKLNGDIKNLPVLRNDTNNVIEFSDGIELYKKKKKNYKFWDLF